MADVSIPSQSRSSTSRTRARRVDTRPNPEPTVAFGFVLDNEYRVRWAKDFLEEYQKQKACTFTPEECEEKIPSLTFALITTIPSLVYRALPDVPRIRDNLLPVEHPELGFEDFVFALRDNSTTERFHSPLTPEIIAAVRKELGLPDGQQPKWVRITVVSSAQVKLAQLNMADIPTNSQPRPRRRADPSKLSADPRPTVAFGFVLDHQCRLRWARYFVAEHAKEKPGAYTPEQIEDMLDSIVRAMNRAIPEHVYAALPDLPRIRWNLLPVRDGKPVSYNLWVFAMRDNSTSWRKRAPMTPEDIEAVRKELGLEEGEEPKWVRIAGI